MTARTLRLTSFVGVALRASGAHAALSSLKSLDGVGSLAHLGAENICGGPEIWRILTVDSSVEGVQNIPWSSITAKAEDYMRNQQAAIRTLRAEIEGLDASIAAAMAREKAVPTTAEQLAGLVRAGTAVFNGVETAQACMCGRPGLRPRFPRDATRRSVEAFKAAAAGLFDGEVRLAGDFLKICRSMLVGERAEEFNYCVNLCQAFKDEAQRLSDESVGSLGGATAEELLKRRAAAVAALGKAESSMQSCQSSKMAFHALAVHVKGLKEVVNVRFERLREAEFDLEDARFELEELEEVIVGEEKAMQEALQALEHAGVNVAAAKKAVKAAGEKAGWLKTQVGETDTALLIARQRLEAAKNADKVVEELRAAVAAISEKMYHLFDASVLEPVRDLGIHEALDLDEYFHGDVGALRSAGMMRDTVDTLDSFCRGEARESFDAVADQIDLSPLCRIGDAGAIKSEITSAVEGRAAEVRASIERVKGWMDPYKSQEGLTAEKMKEFVAAGEPEGLRQVMGVYYDSGLFKAYLKKWEFRGEFLNLIARLERGISALDVAAAELAKKLTSFKHQYTAAIAAREDAELKLKKAVDARGIAESAKEALKEKLAGLHAQGERLRKSIAELEFALQLAKQQFEDAKQALVDSHRRATSFLEFLPAEDPPLALLEVQSARTQELMTSLKDELEGAKLAQAAVRAKMAAMTDA